MRPVLRCVIYSKSSEHRTISVHRDCLIHHWKSAAPVPRCTVTLLSGLGQRERNWEDKRSFTVVQKQDFLCVCSQWSGSKALVKNWKLPSAAKTLVQPITGDAVYYCAPGPALFGCQIQKSWSRQSVLSLWRPSQGVPWWRNPRGWDTRMPHGEHSVLCPFIPPATPFAKDTWPLIKDGRQEMSRKQEWRFPLVDRELIRSADTSSQQKNK